MNDARTSNWDGFASKNRDSFWVLLFSSVVSIAAFFWFYVRGEIMLYGDATARINQARRVFDSLTPGILQIGGVWLPLPKLLLIPLVINDWAWRTGALASLPSMAAFILGAAGVFRLASRGLERSGYPPRTARLGAWTGLAAFLCNPNLLYLQSSAMSETLSLALFVWAVVWLAEFHFRSGLQGTTDRNSGRSLMYCAACLALGVLTRYDFWFFAPFFGAWGLVITLRAAAASRSSANAPVQWFRALGTWISAFDLIAGAGLLWLGLNWIIYGNPLEFANGPYSAKAIQQRMLALGDPHHPGDGHLLLAGLVYLQAAYANFSQGIFLVSGWVLALAGAVWTAGHRRGSVAWLLWLPLPFYALSIAYGNVPVYVPGSSGGNLYNVRYGVELIPALAVGLAWASVWLWQFRFPVRVFGKLADAWPAVLLLGVILIPIGNSYSAPVCYREAADAWPAWRTMDERVAAAIAALPLNSRILMAVALQGRAVQESGRNFRDFIYEDTRDGSLWQRALANPASEVDYAIGFAGDPVDASARAHHLAALKTIESVGTAASPGWPTATLYAARASQVHE